MAVLGALSLGFPATRLDGRLEAVDARRTQFDVGAGQVVAGHDGRRVLVPDGTEHVEADGLHLELVAERLEREAVTVRVPGLERRHVDFFAGLLLEHVDAETVVRGALLGKGGQPGESQLVLLLDAAERQRRVGGPEWDVDGEVVAALGKGVLLRVRDVRVNDDDGDEALAPVKDLHLEAGHVLADEAVDNLARRDLELAEVQLHVGCGLELGHHVGDNVELLDALRDETVVVGAPLALSVVSVDGLVHVTCDLVSSAKR